MKKQMMKWLGGVFALLALSGQAEKVHVEHAGLVVMEMESTESELGEWALVEPGAEGYPAESTGAGHLEYLGPWGKPNSPLVYRFKIEKAGIYHLAFRAYKRLEGLSGDKCNDCFVKMAGDFASGSSDIPLDVLQEDTKLFGGWDKNWGHACRLDNKKRAHLKPAVYEFKAGEIYTFTVSGRSKRFNLDRIVFYHDSLPRDHAQMATLPESTCIELSSTPIVYRAHKDFESTTTGDVPYYIHKGKGALAINAAQPKNREKTALAETTFAGVAGTYDVTITALKELDGECVYSFLVNGQIVGTAQNATTKKDYAPQDHVFKNIKLPANAKIAVQSNCTSNGKIPENGAFAFARGRWTTLTLTPVAAVIAKGASVAIEGEKILWHKITLNLQGPATSESAVPNPFTDYRMDVTFTHKATGMTFVVPGYFAADGDAANSSATAGSTWFCHFRPNLAGDWSYRVAFRQGTHIAMDATEGVELAPFHGLAGSFAVSATNPAVVPDLRAQGRLCYVGKHHLQFEGSGAYFLKFGPDSPENFLEYYEFDNTPEKGHKGRWHTFANHAQHNEHQGVLWQGGKGKNIYGAIDYIASTGANSISMLLNNIGRLVPNPSNPKRPISGPGDGARAFPYTSQTERMRFDCSKLSQWELVFDHAEAKGLYLHFKLGELENYRDLDGGTLGNERKIYYREMIARFGHHLALNWNLSEEIPIGAKERCDAYTYLAQNDPWQNNRVFHTGPSHDKSKFYQPHLGDKGLTGVSLQTPEAIDTENVFNETKHWVDQSAKNGQPWIVACDEQGPGNLGVNQSFDLSRKHLVWGNLMAGGAGVEFYSGGSDLTLDDYAHFDELLTESRYAIRDFFEGQAIPFWTMSNRDDLLDAEGGHCLSDGSETFVVYLVKGGAASIDLSGQGGTFLVRWFDPRNGGALQVGSVENVQGGGMVPVGDAPSEPTQDWAILIRR